MKSILFRSINLAIIFLCAATAASADIKLTVKNNAGGYSSQSTTYIKGARQRTDQGRGMATIFQCDLKRIIQVNDNARTYLVTPLDEEGSPQPAEKVEPEQKQPVQTRRGGVVTYTITTTDTGERKEMFGFTARHIKTSMVKDATPDACDPQKMRIETDGWYIDLQYGLYCSSDKPVVPRMQMERKPECRDEIRYKRVGAAKLGYPILLTTTIYGDGDHAFTSTMEVVDLSTSTLDASLFDVPAGYTEAKNFQELAGAPSIGSITGRTQPTEESSEESVPHVAEAKRAGTIRVGVVTINNKTDRPVSTGQLRDGLIGNILNSNIDAVPLDSRSTSEIEEEAKQKGCDYILYTDIADLKKPSTASRIGGMLGRGGGVLKEKYEARVDFKLFPTGSSSPQLASNATAKEEGNEDMTVSAALEREAKAVVDGIRKKR